jgi:dolichol-phosphate mannosyltransferase
MSVQSSNQSEPSEVIEQSDSMPFTRASRAGGPELSVIVPTFNERDNVEPLLLRLEAALCGIEWEVIYVDDDSPDGTANKIRSLAYANPRTRCIQRIGRRGLSTAVIEGMLSSSAPYLAVIDADLQHDEMVLPRMLDAIKAHDFDIVVGSRYAAGGGIGEWDRRRVAISGVAARLARLLVPVELSDPMSGFFLISRSAFERAARRLSGQGFKILVDLFASTPVPYRFAEIPYVFRQRLHGNSKLDSLVAWEYLMLLIDKRLGGFVPPRFVSFAAVGISGVAVHFITLYCTLQLLTFPVAQALGTIAAMTSNFVLNNVLTYRDRRLSGLRFFTGLASFYSVCSIGAVANVGIASAAFGHHYTWWVSGLAGAVVGSVWNYAVSSTFTWGRR